jgi:hypothetical protein
VIRLHQQAEPVWLEFSRCSAAHYLAVL